VDLQRSDGTHLSPAATCLTALPLFGLETFCHDEDISLGALAGGGRLHDSDIDAAGVLHDMLQNGKLLPLYPMDAPHRTGFCKKRFSVILNVSVSKVTSKLMYKNKQDQEELNI
jgi:hypothetical protein